MLIPQTQKIKNRVKQRDMLGRGSHNIFEQIISVENLFIAWNNFARGKRKRPDAQEFYYQLEDNLFFLREELLNKSWKHGAYEKFTVCDPKPRLIHKAAVRDRLVHHALINIIEAIFDRSFIFDSWSCRRGKGTHRAIIRCQKELRRLGQNNRGVVWVLQCDIKKFFANIDHKILFDLIAKKINDARTLALIDEIVKSFAPGLPLGNLTSQLFANIYLNTFDHFIKEELLAPVYLRYSDDFLLAHQSRQWLYLKLTVIRRYLRDNLKLELHPNKIKLRPWHWGIDWLGYILFPEFRLLRPRTRRRLWRRVHQGTEKYLFGSRSRDSLWQAIASYDGVLKHSWHNNDRGKLIELLRCL